MQSSGTKITSGELYPRDKPHLRQQGSGTPDGFVPSWNQGSYQVLLYRERRSRSMTIKDSHYLVHNTRGCFSEGSFDMLI